MANKSKQRASALAAKTGMSHQAAVNQLRKNKVLPDFAGFTTGSRLFFRPFDALAGGHGESKLPIRGEIRDNQFIVHLLDQQIEIEAIEILRDKKGAVAVLKPAEFALRDGFTLELHLEVDEPLAKGLEPDIAPMLTVRREGAARSAVRQASEERFGPVNLVMPYESDFSLYFQTGGTLEDWQRRDRAADPHQPEAPISRGMLDDDSSRHELELVNVQDFDPSDFDKTSVPDAAHDDPSMPRDPSWPPGQKVLRVPSLNEYIAAREKLTGCKLVEVRPGPALNLAALLPPSAGPVADVVTHVVLVWNRGQSSAGVG